MIRFNPAPGWPDPPENWLPNLTWRPEPTWPPVPVQWAFYLDDNGRPAAPPFGAWAPLPSSLAAQPGLGGKAAIGDIFWVLASGLVIAPVLFWLGLTIDTWIWSTLGSDLSWLIGAPIWVILSLGPSVAVAALTRRGGFAVATAGLALLSTGVVAVALEGRDVTSHLAYVGFGIVLAAAAAEAIGAMLRAQPSQPVAAWGAVGLASPLGFLVLRLIQASDVGIYEGMREAIVDNLAGMAGGIILALPVAYLCCGLLPALVSSANRR